MKIVLLLIVTLCVWQSQACTCINSAFCQKFESASDVIRGTVTRQLPSTSAQTVVFEVSVTSVFKTKNNIAANTKISVSTGPNSAICGFVFQVGQDYLILLNDGSTGLCSGTTTWDSVTPAQKVYLRSPRACGSCTTILCPPRQTCKVDDLGVASCVDSCNLVCPKGQVCQLKDVVCIRAPCPPVPVCVNPCANKVCGEYQTCEIYTPTGEAYCADSCKHFPCPDGQVCQLEPVLCVRAPCPPHATCVDPCANHACGRYQQCKVYPPTGEAYCADTCDGRTCPVAGQRCELVQVECIRAPCPPVARCLCTTICNDLYDPVCGSDGHTYSNLCQLNVANCNRLSQDPTATPVTVVSQGACPNGCSTVRCSAGYVCKVGSDGNGVCTPSCDSFPACPSGQLCQVSSPDVCTPTISPCPPVAHCVNCPAVCPDIYQPVCGSDGTTYGNMCELLRHNCAVSDGSPLVTVAHNGECCPELCPTIVAPVCGSDGKTYNNECELRRTNCGSSPAVVVAHTGSC